MDTEYKSLISWYSAIMLMAFTIGLQFEWSFLVWYFNHLIVIIAFYIERYRLRRYFKDVEFSLYEHKVNELGNYYWKLSKLVKKESIPIDVEMNIRIYLTSSRLMFLLGLLNFISIFFVGRFSAI